MSKRRLVLLMAIFVVLAGINCKEYKKVSRASPEMNVISEQALYKSSLQPASEYAPAPAEMGDKSSDEGSPATSPNITQKVIYTADFKVEVKKYEEGFEAIKKITADVGGFVADSNVEEDSSGAKYGTVKIRVPAAKFNDVISGIRGIGKVKSQAEHGYDVTEEYFDLETRLAISKQMEERLVALLKTETNKVKDLLEVEKELGRVRGDIEQMEGHKRFLDDRLQLSTITINIFEPHIYTSSVFDPVKDAFSSAGELFMSSIGALIKFFAAVIPWLLIGGPAGWLIIKVIKRLRRKKKAE